MSFNNRRALAQIAKIVCRDLRKRQTKAESIIWEAVRDRGIDGKKFLRQHPIFHDITGRETFFVADFYCHESGLVIELDGEYHKYRLSEDGHRDMILNCLGLKVIRIKNEEVETDLKGTLERIKGKLRKL